MSTYRYRNVNYWVGYNHYIIDTCTGKWTISVPSISIIYTKESQTLRYSKVDSWVLIETRTWFCEYWYSDRLEFYPIFVNNAGRWNKTYWLSTRNLALTRKWIVLYSNHFTRIILILTVIFLFKYFHLYMIVEYCETKYWST